MARLFFAERSATSPADSEDPPRHAYSHSPPHRRGDLVVIFNKADALSAGNIIYLNQNSDLPCIAASERAVTGAGTGGVDTEAISKISRKFTNCFKLSLPRRARLVILNELQQARQGGQKEKVTGKK